MLRNLKVTYSAKCFMNYCTRVQLDPSLKENFETNEFKPRKHPGKSRIKVASIPPDIIKSIKLILEDSNAKTYYPDSKKLVNYLDSRLLPPEERDIDVKAGKIYQGISKKYLKSGKIISEEETKLLQQKTFSVLKKNLYNWGNIVYDKPTSLQYLMTRAAPEYAVLVSIFDEIRRRLPEFKPRSFFDFGSGIGTGTWAVNTFWKGDIFEYFCVDTSPDMHDLCTLILSGGKENASFPIKGYFQRQFLPASADLKYNIVLSSYALLEMPNMQSRLETIQKLWNKTEDFLIIVENGTNAGFEIVNEAREFILNLEKSNDGGYAFAPCPNDNVCPRYLEHKTPCNFIMKFEPLPFPKPKEVCAELFSYIVLRKGARPEDDPQWPRLVRAPLVRSKHTVCRLCTKKGELEEIIFSKARYDRITYRCARSSVWGELLPVK